MEQQRDIASDRTRESQRLFMVGSGTQEGASRAAEARGSAASAAPGVVPPTLTGGERVSGRQPGQESQPREAGNSFIERMVLTINGQTKRILRRHGVSGDAAFLDWINFTCGDDSFEWQTNDCDLSEERTVCDASLTLEGIFGFGVTKKLPNGRNFYNAAYSLGDDWGFLAIGGQRGTIQISVSGTGLAAARDGWESRLMAWLNTKAKRPKLTRVDVAHDCYDGQYTVDQARDEYRAGGADCRGRMPVCEERGDWYRPKGAGRTFYIGKRTNGKFARIYEKGKQLGDPTSEWVRVEVEFKSVDRIIPHDILVNPGKYLAGAYPMFEWISKKAERIATIKKALAAGYEKSIRYAQRQIGGTLNFIVEMEGSVEQAFTLLRRKATAIPPWAKKAAPILDEAPVPLHRWVRIKPSMDQLIEQSIAAM
jgi:phage replication initiation protein